MKLIHPADAPFGVVIPSIAVEVAPGGTFDAPDDVAERLIEQGFQPAPKPKPKEA